MENLTIGENSHGLEFLPDHRGDGHLIADDIPLNPADDISDVWDAIESGIFGDLGGGLDLGVRVDEEDMDSPYQFGETPDNTEVGNFPLTGKGRISVGGAIVRDFDTIAEQVAYILVHENIMACFQNSVTKQKQAEALSWVFCGAFDKCGRTFDQCCRVLRVRPWILQTRLQFQFFSKGMVFLKPFTTETLRLPTIMEAESLYYGGYEGAIISTITWSHPGIKHSDLVQQSKESLRAVHLMEERGIISENGGCWYATGRNPMLKLRLRKTVSWSEEWPIEA